MCGYTFGNIHLFCSVLFVQRYTFSFFKCTTFLQLYRDDNYLHQISGSGSGICSTGILLFFRVTSPLSNSLLLPLYHHTFKKLFSRQNPHSNFKNTHSQDPAPISYFRPRRYPLTRFWPENSPYKARKFP